MIHFACRVQLSLDHILETHSLEPLYRSVAFQLPLDDVRERAGSPNFSSMAPTRQPTASSEIDSSYDIERRLAGTPTGMPIDRSSAGTPNFGQNMDLAALGRDRAGAITLPSQGAAGSHRRVVRGTRSVLYPAASLMRRNRAPFNSPTFSGPSRAEMKRLAITSMSTLAPVMETDEEDHEGEKDVRVVQNAATAAGLTLTRSLTEQTTSKK